MSNGALDHLSWPSLARDLAVMTVPDTPLRDMDYVYSTYHITQEELASIMLHPEFKPMLERELENCRSQGKRAGQIYRFATLGQALAEKLYNDAMSADAPMKPSDAIKLLELYLKAAGMTEAKDAPVVNVQTNVGVQLPLPTGLNNPKLKHLEAHDVSV